MSRQEVFFTVQGHPRPQGSKRYLGNGRFIEASDVHPWRKAIASKVFETMQLTGDERSFTEPVIVWATFRLPRPKTVKRFYPSVAPDLDKLCRALGDALSVDSHLLTDDSLIVQWHAKKRYAPADEAGVSVTIRLAPQPNKEGTTK